MCNLINMILFIFGDNRLLKHQLKRLNGERRRVRLIQKNVTVILYSNPFLRRYRYSFKVHSRSLV